MPNLEVVTPARAESPAGHVRPLPPRRPAPFAADLGPLLVAPAAVTPTKALTPSHVKGLLWLDVLFKATARLRDTVYVANRRALDTAMQTAGFWVYLDRYHAGESYADKDEAWIGARYVEFHRSAVAPCPALLTSYRERIERDGWTHPASRRVLQLWASYYELLGLHDPGLSRSEPLPLDAEGLLEELRHLDSLLDLRAVGGGVYLDRTDEGLPLRQMIDPRGAGNYLLGVLRELLPAARAVGSALLLCDDELVADYVLVERLLGRAGVSAARLSLGRVPLDNGVQSSRNGGWEAYTFDRFVERYVPRFGREVFRLGMRLYFIAGLRRTAGVPFDFAELDRSMARAARLLEAPRGPDDPDALDALLRWHWSPAGFVDPIRLANLLFVRRPDPAHLALLPLFT